MKWFLAGLGIGVAFGIAMAPARGEESRRRLRDTATQAWDDMSDEARATLEQMRSSDWARQARDAANEARQRVSSASRDVAERVANMSGRTREQTPVVRQEGEEARPDIAAGVSDDSAGAKDGTPAKKMQTGGNGHVRGSLLDLLNDASQDELIAVNGIGPVLALRIVQHRPYKTEQQPLEDNVIPPSAYEALREHLKKPA